MGALGGCHLARHESNYQRSSFTLGWTSLNFDIETNEESFRLVLFEKLHCVYLKHFGVVANFHLQTSTRLELALFCSEKQFGPYQMRKAYNDQKV
jgi:hypothetical protein